MLSEMIMTCIEDSKILQINTDGITTIIPKNKENDYLTVCKEWEDITKLSLEHQQYSKMVTRDVNNYLSVTLDNKIKYKGAFKTHEEMIKDGEYHKAFNQGIVPIALSNYYTKDISPEETIKNHTNIYNFCKTFNATHGWKCETLDIDDKGIESNHKEEQKNNRYYISKNGRKFRKHKWSNKLNKEQYIDIEATNKVIIFNRFIEKPFEEYDIDFDYYVAECYKIIDTISGEKERKLIQKKQESELAIKERQERNYLDFCVLKVPTQRQFDLYKRDWLIEKFGVPSVIKPSRAAKEENKDQLNLFESLVEDDKTNE